MSAYSIGVIIPAAGASRRYQEDDTSHLGGPVRSKLDEDLGGRPVLQRTVELFNKRDDVACIVVAGPADDQAFADFSARHADKLSLLGARLCRGGKTHRYETVANALPLIPDSCTHIAIHDAARPCAGDALIDRVFRAAAEKGFDAVIPGIDTPDTLKRVHPEWMKDASHDPLAAILGDAGADRKLGRYVDATIPRESVVSVQTPQIFKAELLRKAYAQADLASTDDAQLVERIGGKVLVVPGESTNIKITRAGDITLARAILGVRPPQERAAHKRF